MMYDKEGWAAEVLIDRGQRPPSWYYEEPDVPPGFDFMMSEFSDLSTERQIGLAIGPIPVSKIRERQRELDLDAWAGTVFKTVITAMDAEFRAWVSREKERNAKSHDGLSNKSGGRSGGRKVRHKGR